MFFKQVWRNAAKSRKGNGLFFGTLVIAIVAFYTLLSLGEQDVMRFLSTIESDAVHKLMMLLPAVYAVSLFFVFFLVYFAGKYQMNSRRREFGMYLMLGMKKSRLFFMLFMENLWNSLISLLIGLPIALFLTEGISLATAKIVGLGIIGHTFALSTDAILLTIAGYVLVQFLSMLVICLPIARTEPAQLMHYNASNSQTGLSKAKSSVFFVSGIILLLIAYGLGIFCLAKLELITVFALLVCGLLGTFFLYRGLGGFLGKRIHKKSVSAKGLAAFTGRQVQENVTNQYKSLAVSSLLLLMALSCVSYGIAMGTGRSVSSRSTDFSLFGTDEQIDAVLHQDDIRKSVKDSYPMYLSMVKDGYFSGEEHAFETSELKKTLNAIEGADNIVQNLRVEYVIAESSYNHVLKSMGKEEMDLFGGKVALYSSIANDGDFGTMVDTALEKGCSIGIDGVNYEIIPSLFYDNVVADRAITIYTALIVPDDLYKTLARESEAHCRNICLTDEVVDDLGLLQAVRQVGDQFDMTGIEYDSYLGGIGRNLFYSVAASYLTIYLGVLFLLIANTVIGLKYLIEQRQNIHRYVTLSMLGANTQAMCRSVKKQIHIFFALVLGVSLISSIAAIWSMFTSFTKLPVGTSMTTVALLAGIMLAVFALAEAIYIRIVERTACKEIVELDITK